MTPVGCGNQQKSSSIEKSNGEKKQQVDSQQADLPVALQKSLDYLIGQQAADGGWHSQTYGNLKPGAAITCQVLYALSHLPESVAKKYEPQIRKAVGFLQQGMTKSAYIANEDGSPDYPTYASAMLLVANDRLKLQLPEAQIQKLIQYLIDAQLDESRGFKPDSVHYGGWDLMGATDSQGQTTGTNISVMCYTLEALSLFRQKNNDPQLQKTFARAKRWLAGCQNYNEKSKDGDGGFFFTPDIQAVLNKGGLIQKDPPIVRSYGTTTCDGIRCLRYCAEDIPRFNAAVQWMVEHPLKGNVPGLDHPQSNAIYASALNYYFLATYAKTLQYLPEKTITNAATTIEQSLVSLQNESGSWKNSNNQMREDDPLIATCHGVVALCEILKYRDK